VLKKLFGKKPPIESDSMEYLKRMEEGQKKYATRYSKVPPKVKALKAKGRHKDAIKLLLPAVDLVEAEADYIGEGWGVAPWYYEQLAIIYRKEKDYSSEVKILERYLEQNLAPGKGPEKLTDRLTKAKLLLKNADAK